MSAARAFGMERMDRAALHRREGIFDEAALVQRVGMEGDLHVLLVGDGKTIVDRGGRRAPVLMQLQADDTSVNLLAQRLGLAGVALAEIADIDRQIVGGFEHAVDVPRPRRHRGRKRADGRAGAAADQSRGAARQRLVGLLRRDEMDMRVDAAGRENLALAGDDIGAGADGDRDAGLDVGIAGLADRGNAAVLDADVGLHDPPVVEDDRIGDDDIGDFGGEALSLPHAVADDLAAAKRHFLAVDRVVLLDLDDERRVGEPDAVALGRAVEGGVGLARDLRHVSPPVCP